MQVTGLLPVPWGLPWRNSCCVLWAVRPSYLMGTLENCPATAERVPVRERLSRTGHESAPWLGARYVDVKGRPP